jgi:hypothetical protein
LEEIHVHLNPKGVRFKPPSSSIDVSFGKDAAVQSSRILGLGKTCPVV